MTILDSVKGTVNTAVDTISTVAQTIVEKNRTNAKLNRLRLVMIDSSKAKIAKARECYRQIVDSSNDIFYGNPDVVPEVKKDDIVDITVACSNENEYKSSPFKEEKPAEESAKEEADALQEKAEPEHVTKICDLKAELEAKREEGFAESADTEEDDDSESPHGELF